MAKFKTKVVQIMEVTASNIEEAKLLVNMINPQLIIEHIEEIPNIYG